MIEKKIKNLKESRRDGVLIEYLESKFDLVLEGNLALEGIMNRNHEEFREFVAETKFNFGVVAGALQDIREKTDHLEDKVDTLDSKVDRLERTVGVSS